MWWWPKRLTPHGTALQVPGAIEIGAYAKSTSATTLYAVTSPVLTGSSSQTPTESNTRRQMPAGGTLFAPFAPKAGLDFAWSRLVTVLIHVPASAVGGCGAGSTRAVTTSVGESPSAL